MPTASHGYPRPRQAVPTLAALLLAVVLLGAQGCGDDPTLASWHTLVLTEEFTADMAGEQVRDLRDYLDLEERLFRQLDEQIVQKTPTGAKFALARYSRDSAASPSRWPRDWNRTFDLDADAPIGGVLLLLTRDVDRRIRALLRDPAAASAFPTVIALKSTVDTTVTTEAIVDNLLKRLPGRRNELVLFDINRHAAIASSLLVADPAPLTDRLMAEESLPFAVTFVTNESSQSANVVARYEAPLSPRASSARPLGLAWPSGVVSLSPVALPFPPDDPLYGRGPATSDDRIFLGDMALRGERGLVRIPADWLLRQRYNPFYPYLEARILQWLEARSES